MSLLLQDNSALSEQDMDIIIMTIIGICVYFIPSIIAIIRSKRNWITIITINLLLGWSIIGWVISLIWSLTNDNNSN